MEVIKHGNIYKEVECPGCRALLSYCKGDIKTKFIEDEDYVEKLLYGKNVYDDDYIPTCRSFHEYKRISSIMNQNKNAFMKLFNIFFWELYD